MKKIYLFVMLCISSFAFAGSPLLIEDFNYTVGEALTLHDWAIHSGTSNPLVVTSPGLTFSGYVGSAVGNATGLNNTGDDENKLFTTQTTGSVYVSFLVNASATNISGSIYPYFLHFVDATISSAFRAKCFIVPGSTSDKMKIGFSFNSNTATTYETELNFGETYLLVAKYVIVTGDLNDYVSLYIFKAGDDISSEPITPTIGPLTQTASGTDIAPAGVALRQFDAAQRITVDGIRVRTEWHLNDDANVVTAMSQLNENRTVCYPNPVTDGFVNLANAGSSMKDVQIFDIVGKRVFNQQTISNRVDVSSLNQGIYLLKVSANNQTSSARFVIK